MDERVSISLFLFYVYLLLCFVYGNVYIVVLFLLILGCVVLMPKTGDYAVRYPANVIQRVFELKADGKSLSKVSEILEQETGVYLSRSTIDKMLKENRKILEIAETKYFNKLSSYKLDYRDRLLRLVDEIEGNKKLTVKDRYYLLLNYIKTLHLMDNPVGHITIKSDSPTIQIAQIVKGHLEHKDN